MLLSLNHISYAFPSPKTYSSSLICPFPKTLIFEYHTSSSSSSSSSRRRHPSLQFLIRSSSADNPTDPTLTPPSNALPTSSALWASPKKPKPKRKPLLEKSSSLYQMDYPSTGYHELRREVKREREAKKGEGKVPSLAELSLPNEELRRLRTIGIAEKRKLKVGKAGVTEGIVNGIHERWRRSEVVKIVCEDLCRMNMKRTHDLLERKTGGLVVWRVGSKIVLYRGADYRYPYFFADTSSVNGNFS
ncbi:hypothetical protein OIU76_019667 [Salix suchowensis]|nr:hypothetical protein OIU76_019667 [Salix suchowensis]